MPRLPFSRSRLSAKYPQPMVDFVAALVQLEERDGKTDEQFSSELGISVHLWRKTRDGSVRLGLKLWAAGAELVGYQLATVAHGALMERARQRWPKRNGEAA